MTIFILMQIVQQKKKNQLTKHLYYLQQIHPSLPYEYALPHIEWEGRVKGIGEDGIENDWKWLTNDFISRGF